MSESQSAKEVPQASEPQEPSTAPDGPEDRIPDLSPNAPGTGDTDAGESATRAEPAPVAVPSQGKTADDRSWANPKAGEWATILFGAAILVVTLFLIVAAFLQIDGGSPQAYEQRKDLVLVALGLMGTVTGYFFGRVPAESRARRAEDQASGLTQAAYVSASNLQKSEAENSQLEMKVEDAFDTITQVQERLGTVEPSTVPGPAPGMPSFSSTEPPPTSQPAEAEMIRLRTQLDDLRVRLGR